MEENVVIDQVVITPEIINIIRWLQKDDNEALELWTNSLLKIIPEFTDHEIVPDKETYRHICSVCEVVGILNRFRAD